VNRPQRLSYFLVLDASYSMESSWEILKSNLLDHLERLTQWKRQQPGLVLDISLSIFNQGFYLNRTTSDFELVKAVFEKVKPEGQSALYDALGTVLQRIYAEVKQENIETTYWMLCFFTDARDNCSAQFEANQINELLGKINFFNSNGNRFKGVILGALPEGVNGMECLDLDESSEAFSEELDLSFSYLEKLLMQMGYTG
jgi:hypothetical protein